MSPITWLAYFLVIVALMWMPYILNSFAVRGIFPSMGYAEDLPELSAWAVRAKKAHANAVENLALFAPSVLAYHVLVEEVSAAVTTAAMVFVVARVAHYVVYTAKIPVARTVTFLVGWGANLFIIYSILSA